MSPDITELQLGPDIGSGDAMSPAHLVLDAPDGHAARLPITRSVRRLAKDWSVRLAVGWICVVGLVAVVGLFWTPHPPNEQAVTSALQGPSLNHLLGTDNFGRDVASRLMVGSAVSLRVSIQVVAMAMAVSLPLGLLSGYKGATVDAVLMRLLDTLTSVPSIVLAVAIAGVLGPGLGHAMIAMTIILIPVFSRLLRAQALAVSAQRYVAASRVVGASTPRILATRILPGVLPALIVQVSLAMGTVLVADASLSYLGLGVQPPNATWGAVLRNAHDSSFLQPSGVVAPALLIGSVVLAFNLVGDGLRDALGAGISKARRRRARLGLTSVARGEQFRQAPGAAAPVQPVSPVPVLSVVNLHVDFDARDRAATEVLAGVSFDVQESEILALVGESGCGKTVTALSIMRLLPSPPATVTAGKILLNGTDLLGHSLREMKEVRGAEISMVFQNPMASLDPSFTIGNSMIEAIRAHQSVSHHQAKAEAIELLGLVGMPSPGDRIDDYPHRFSGGMQQRVMIACALAKRPKLLIADEPTTALDVTVQAEILDLLRSLRNEFKMAMILVTHDLGVVADICDRVAVMYAGQIVESGAVEEVYATPGHPYTRALLASVPSLSGPTGRLATIAGLVPTFDAMPAGCRFLPRCPFARQACARRIYPVEMGRTHHVQCIRVGDLEVEAQL